MNLAEELAALPEDMKRRLAERGFSAERLLSQARGIGQARDERNRYKGGVTPPGAGDVVDAPVPGTEEHARCHARGLELLRAGKVALCVLAGGMATRMGGVVKALVEAIPGKTFLELRLGEQRALERLSGRKVPLWLMVSEATKGGISDALGSRLDGRDVALFEQCVSLRLTPEGALFRENGEVSVYATGHGDLPDALRASGLLKDFLATRGDGYVWLTNLDNLGATVDPALLGWHAGHASPLSVEVVDKVGTDRGGVPVLLEGRRIIAEEFRLPKDVDPNAIRVFNTNTFLADARALEQLAFEFTWVEVEKTIGAAKAIQFERLLGEISVPLEPLFLRVPREGVASRFLPVKDNDELARRREEIRAIAESRGMLL